MVRGISFWITWQFWKGETCEYLSFSAFRANTDEPVTVDLEPELAKGTQVTVPRLRKYMEQGGAWLEEHGTNPTDKSQRRKVNCQVSNVSCSEDILLMPSHLSLFCYSTGRDTTKCAGRTAKTQAPENLFLYQPCWYSPDSPVTLEKVCFLICVRWITS